MPHASKFRLALAVVAVVFAARAPAAEPASTQAALAALAGSHWIADGRDDAPRKVYVFLDANCGYCTKFWSDARPWVESGKVQLREILVAVIAPSSAGKAATLLADPSPSARLADYERARAFEVARLMAAGEHSSLKGMPPLPELAPIPPALSKRIDDGNALMNAFGIQGTPGLAYVGADGRLVVKSGLAPQELAQVLGPR